MPLSGLGGSRSCHVGLLGELDVSELLSGSHHVLVLDSHNTTSPHSAELLVVVVLILELLAHGIEVGHILLTELGNSDASGSLHVAELTKGSLSTNEAVGDTLLSAEGWEVDNHLNGVDIVGNHDELGSVLLNEGSDVVKTELEVDWLGSLASTALSLLLESVLLLLSGLRAVFGEQFKELGGYNCY